jgi:hypothetical protein
MQPFGYQFACSAQALSQSCFVHIHQEIRSTSEAFHVQKNQILEHNQKANHPLGLCPLPFNEMIMTVPILHRRGYQIL